MERSRNFISITPEFCPIYALLIKKKETNQSVWEVCILRSFRQNIVNTKFEQRDDHGKFSGRHGRALKLGLQCQWNLESTQDVYISIYQKLAVIIFEAPDSIYCDTCIFHDRIIFCWPSYHCTIVYKRAFPYVIRIRGKDKADRATAEQVMDPRTRMILFKMLSRQLINEINGCISTGKEANVYHACTPTGQDRAIKVSPVTTRVTRYY